jgi:peroxiredoxin
MPIAPGAAFPNLTLPTLDGGPCRLADVWSAGPAVLAVGHSECGTTRLALPFVDRIHRRRPPTAGVLAIFQDDEAGAAAFARELDLRLPLALDRKPYEAGEALAIETVPTLYLVGADGRVSRVVEGFDRAAYEEVAREAGLPQPLFTDSDEVPTFRPG